MDTEMAYDVLLTQELTKRLEEQLTPQIEHNILAVTVIGVLQDHLGAAVTPEQAQVIKANDSDFLKHFIGRIRICAKDEGIDDVLSQFGLRRASSPFLARLAKDIADQLIPKIEQEMLAATVIRLLTLHFGARPTPEQAEAVKSTGSAQLMDAVGRISGLKTTGGIDGALTHLNIKGYDSLLEIMLTKRIAGQLRRQIEHKTLAAMAIHLLQLRYEVELTPEQAQAVKSAVPEHLKRALGEIGRLGKADGLDNALCALKMTRYDSRFQQGVAQRVEERLTPQIEQKTLAALALELLSERTYPGEDLTAEKAQAIQAADLSRLKSGIGDIALWKTVRLDGALDTLGLERRDSLAKRKPAEEDLEDLRQQMAEQTRNRLADLAIRVMEQYFEVTLTGEQKAAIMKADSEHVMKAIPQILTFAKSTDVDRVLLALGMSPI